MLEGYQPIRKTESDRSGANLKDYDGTRRTFTWDEAKKLVTGLPGGGGLNIAYEAADRHATGSNAGHTAIRWLGKHGTNRDITYAELSSLSNRFANVLASLGVAAGERICVLMGRVPELYISAIGILKHRAVFCPMFSAFGPEPIQTRVSISGATVLITSESLYRKKVAQIREKLPALRHVILVSDEGGAVSEPGCLDFATLMSGASDSYEIGPTDPEMPAILHFTSGTTGTPKGAIHVHQAVVVHQLTGKFALDLHPDDVFWCTADPGWVTGTSYGIIAPLTLGVTNIVDEADFAVDRWYGILQEQKVTVWYTAPTAIRMLMKAGEEPVKKYDLSRVRFMGSVGEPLNPEAVVWSERVLGKPFHDNWWQTETGGIMVANYACMDIRPGSMGRPLPGIEAALIAKQEDGSLKIITEPGVQGELALRPGWPSMFRGYWNNEERYRKSFADGWYLSGDLALRDADGYYWFVGRADDVIKTAGHLIGPFEVESTLMQHPSVAEAGVIGKPDPVAMEVIKAFVTLKKGIIANDNLKRDLMAFARKRLGPAVAPREIEIRDWLPKTRSGKIMRRLLKAQELGLPPGDISTLEEQS
ncbi:MAG: acetate--CoA ligase [Deltaproteobacteria bacterium]|nr:acetate--CoA ligase [Deltaproteobacteria bacterium]